VELKAAEKLHSSATYWAHEQTKVLCE